MNDTSVGIIGAGAAGITAARALTKLGHKVTVLESAERIGGQCYTFKHQGQAYDMGAVAMVGTRSPARKLASSLGIDSKLCLRYQYIEPGRRQELPYDVGLASLPSTLRLLKEVAKVKGPGFHGMDKALAIPFDDWVRQKRVTPLAEILRPLTTAIGYGFFDEIAATYILKHLTRFRPDCYQFVDHGVQGVFEKAAEELDIRLKHPVTSISRDGRNLVSTPNETFEFDKLIITSDPQRTMGFLDARANERALLGRFKCFQYHSVLCEVRGLPSAHFGFFPHRLQRLQPGMPASWTRRTRDSDMCVVYSFVDDEMRANPELIHAAHREHFKQIGAEFGEVFHEKTWDYFPHVGNEDIADGFFDRFEALQGENNTYYAGQYLSFPTVRHVMEFSEDLVQRFFAAPTLSSSASYRSTNQAQSSVSAS